jgi:hypothetical protein
MDIPQGKLTKVAPYDYEVELTGSDFLGRWTGKGDFLMTSAGPFFWMLKIYQDRELAGQTGALHNLIYESSWVSGDGAEGKWFYEHMECAYNYSGKWKITRQEDEDDSHQDNEMTPMHLRHFIH